MRFSCEKKNAQMRNKPSLQCTLPLSQMQKTSGLDITRWILWHELVAVRIAKRIKDIFVGTFSLFFFTIYFSYFSRILTPGHWMISGCRFDPTYYREKHLINQITEHTVNHLLNAIPFAKHLCSSNSMLSNTVRLQYLLLQKYFIMNH